MQILRYASPSSATPCQEKAPAEPQAGDRENVICLADFRPVRHYSNSPALQAQLRVQRKRIMQHAAPVTTLHPGLEPLKPFLDALRAQGGTFATSREENLPGRPHYPYRPADE